MDTFCKVVTVSFLVMCCCSKLCFAEEPGQGKLVLGLNACIQRALASAPELGESRADIELAASKLAEAKSHRFPKVELLNLIGPVPQARGNQVFSPDRINQTDRLTWFDRADATIVQPLYTFGKISESMKAAGHGIEVDRAKQEQRQNEIALKVKEYYYGLLLSRELKEMVLDIRESLTKARDKARKLLKEESPNVDELDIFKLDAFAGEVDKYLEEANKGESLALSALKTQIAVSPGVEMDIETERLTTDEVKIPDLPLFLEASKAKRPEYKQIDQGLRARAALVEAAKAAYYPDIFLGGYLSAAYAEKRDRITNPYVPDEFNHLWGGVALGLKWSLDFGITGAKVAAERAQYNRLVATKEFAESNIPLQIRKSYLEIQEAEKSIEATRSAYTNAKKWVVAAIANFDFGVGPAQEIFDALQNYARMRAEYFQSLYNFKLAQANLAYAVGEAPL